MGTVLLQHGPLLCRFYPSAVPRAFKHSGLTTFKICVITRFTTPVPVGGSCIYRQCYMNDFPSVTLLCDNLVARW